MIKPVDLSKVDTSRHKWAWHTSSDIDLHCVCGEQLQLGGIGDDGEELTIICPNCRQKWSARLLVYPVLEFAHMVYPEA